MSDFAPYLPGMLLGFTLFSLAMLSPGPNILTIMGTSMSVGRKQGMAMAFGTSLGSFLWAVLTISGVTILVTTNPWILIAIKIAGGMYLLWLAYKSFKAAGSYQDMSAHAITEVLPLWRFGLRGLTVQMTNPKAAIFWVAIAALALKADTPWYISAIFVLGTFVISFVGYQIYAILFSTPWMIKGYTKARRPIQYALGSFFGFAGLKLLLTKT